MDPARWRRGVSRAGVLSGARLASILWKGRFWPILLKKSLSERAAFRRLRNRPISALLR
ncbi:hypothetical protein PSEUDO8AS_70062 [Pseudomonas sp. 8AS]|nr:hypothetical protein PSEUDO8AS_70062 [Pseudomonas sp. 8AS]